MKKLSNLRLFFIIYFLVKTVVELVFGYNIYQDSLENIQIPGVIKSPATFVILTLLSNTVLFLLGLLVFHFLLQKKNWARILLLVVGIITVLDAISGLLFSSSLYGLACSLFSPSEWGQLVFLDRVTDLIGMVFWGYAVYLLLADRNVKECFTHPDSGGANPGANPRP